MRRRIALFASGAVGTKVANLLKNSDDEVVHLSLAGQNIELDEEILDNLGLVDNLFIYRGDLRTAESDYTKIFRELGVDTIITVYWPYILPKEIYEKIEITVNFHPALLPLNRGWYPHVHNILDGSPAGVTLHKLSELPDEGDIWSQKAVEAFPWDCADELYFRLQDSIFELFSETWNEIRNGEIKPKPQENSKSSYHSKREILIMDEIDLDKNMSARELINLLRARTFGKKSYAYFKYENRRIFMRISFDKEEMI